MPVEGTANTRVEHPDLRPRRYWQAGDDPIGPNDVANRDEVVYVRADRRNPDSTPLPEDRIRLGGPESWPDESHTPEQRAALIAEGRQRAAQVVGKDDWSNAKFAGERYFDKLPDALKERYPEGVQFSYEGFPIFDRPPNRGVRGWLRSTEAKRSRRQASR